MRKKSLLLAVLMMAATNLMPCKAQMEELPEMGQFVFKGKIDNVNPEKPGTLSLAVCDIWENELYDIPLQADGTFTKAIPIRNIQEVYLYIGDTFTLYVCDGDTITLSMDNNRWRETLNISGHTPERDRELKLSVELYWKMRERNLNLNAALRKPLRDYKQSATDSTLMKQVVEYINDYSHIIEKWEQTHGHLPHKEAFLISAFFGQLYFLAGNADALRTLQYGWNLESALKGVSVKGNLIQTLRPQWLIHTDYRTFIASYCENVQTQAVISFNGNVSSNNESFILRAKVGEMVIPNSVIREYALIDNLKTLIRALGYENLLPYIAYLDSTVSTPWIREQMETIKQENSVWSNGKPAPEFDFVDKDGKHYTLADFKGRFIYLDIWGVGCGPCYQEFKNIPALHEKYNAHKERIAYVYLCGHYSNKENWLRTAQKHGLTEYNLALPEGYKGIYNIGVFPTYILIDTEGKIVEYNTARPSQLLQEKGNILDKSLKISH